MSVNQDVMFVCLFPIQLKVQFSDVFIQDHRLQSYLKAHTLHNYLLDKGEFVFSN